MYTIYIVIYRVILYVIQPLIWISLLWYCIRFPYYRKNWLERYGFLNKKRVKPNGIILHAVSLGETLAAVPLVKILQKHYPGVNITLTAMTPTGIELAKSIFKKNVICSYLPYDLPGSVNRFVSRVQPKLVIVMETELWPNLINILYKRDIPFIIVNARLSCRSFKRYKKCGYFISLLMKRVTLVAAQNIENASRFLQLGMKKDRLFITGNLKFDIEISYDLLKKISVLKKTWVKTRRVWIAGSTHSGEEIVLLQAHKILLKSFPDLLLIIAPRHLERTFSVKSITECAGFSYIMSSDKIDPSAEIQVVINDVVGELMLLYGISDIAFVGGSLVRHGGHNPLEPAAHSIPVIMGPYTFNFYDICMKLHESNGLITIFDDKSLASVITQLLIDGQARRNYGDRAFKVLKCNQGVLKNLLYLLNRYLLV
ncbi:lipid IV(A) 3-deoxy-D-manno-octulosonic acid transferase [Candidatus Blochmannia ocreatus (nom. nud.)]|uniref:3-deoxy-D-manno-octulosonic acid transferase n=1 Tax=Candidatus Blochmannia ocreatus (nom. nud.) TaxID=251538 RepID=A0ABY4ST72_9ENTR|nr:lipid IV(A) 3-deoxy-D-manno-octulosonic acid transferase [Candidatus Blochmannia ocreatus]URJ25076.1 lipid IV(A) 3-deoxy-D-manno-octulosonic acid transferase [Candidatus Blochmannia ocreatus]